MPSWTVFGAALLAPVALALWSHRAALRIGRERGRPSYFAFAQRTQWAVLLSVCTWLPLSVPFAWPWAQEQLGAAGPWAEGSAAAALLFGPPLLTAVLVSLLGHDVARRAGITDWRGADAAADAGLILAGTLAPAALALGSIAALGMDRPGESAGGMVLALVLAATVLVWRRRRAGFRLHAITHGPLRDSVFALAERVGVRLRQLYVVPLRRVRLANAFAIQGNTVILTDVLLEQLDREEIDAVLAHEMAHIQRKDPGRLARALIAAGAATAATAAFAGWRAAMPVMLLGLLADFAYTRRIEYAADARALTLGADPRALVRGLARLSRLSQVPLRWSRARGLLLTHPSVEQRAYRIAAAAGLDAGVARDLLDRIPEPGPRWAVPEPVAEPRVFGSEFRRAVLARLGLSVLLASVIAPAIVVTASIRLGLPRAMGLGLSVIAGFAAWHATWALLAFRPLAGVRRALGPRLKPVAASVGADRTFFVGLSPDESPRVYEGFVEWDVGVLALSPGRLDYAGEEARFTLRAADVRQVRLDRGHPGWIPIRMIRVRWERPDGSSGVFGVVPVGAAHALAVRSETRALRDLLEEWREEAPVGEAEPGEAVSRARQAPGLGGPPSEQVTSTSPREALTPRGLVLTAMLQLALAATLGAMLGLELRPAAAGAWDVAAAAIATQLLAAVPMIRWRDPAAGARPAAEPDRRAA